MGANDVNPMSWSGFHGNQSEFDGRFIRKILNKSLAEIQVVVTGRALLHVLPSDVG